MRVAALGLVVMLLVGGCVSAVESAAISGASMPPVAPFEQQVYEGEMTFGTGRRDPRIPSV